MSTKVAIAVDIGCAAGAFVGVAFGEPETSRWFFAAMGLLFCASLDRLNHNLIARRERRETRALEESP